jgi:sorbitol-specific phosphotransferase system component IIC
MYVHPYTCVYAYIRPVDLFVISQLFRSGVVIMARSISPSCVRWGKVKLTAEVKLSYRLSVGR